MSLDGNTLPTSPAGRLGILLGLLGLGAGVVAVLSGQATLGLVAGILALVAPTAMLREISHAATTPAPTPSEGESVAPIEPVGTQPFHMDSDLLTAEYFPIAVNNRLTAARRFLKPLAIVQMHVTADGDPATADTRASAVVLSTLRDCDTAYVMGPGRLALVLEDTPESGAVWALERVRRSLATIDPSLTMWAGIACYPAHAMDNDKLMGQCEAALQRAREWPQERIEVALAD
ncbi:MAG: hypothetical protein P8N02_03135 [Actinomycetota bacterium]|nr:hypothetical protein [Actinomycetota bacterium]